MMMCGVQICVIHEAGILLSLPCLEGGTRTWHSNTLLQVLWNAHYALTTCPTTTAIRPQLLKQRMGISERE